MQDRGDVFTLRPRPKAWRASRYGAVALGLLMVLPGVAFIVAYAAHSTEAPLGVLLVGIGCLVAAPFAALMTYVYNAPSVLRVSTEEIRTSRPLGSSSMPRSRLRLVYRGLASVGRGATVATYWFVSLSGWSDVAIRRDDFDEAELEASLHRLGVPIDGDFTKRVDSYLPPAPG